MIELSNNLFLTANYEADPLNERVIVLVKHKEGVKISGLPSPWRERFITFSIDNKNFLFPESGTTKVAMVGIPATSLASSNNFRKLLSILSKFSKCRHARSINHP